MATSCRAHDISDCCMDFVTRTHLWSHQLLRQDRPSAACEDSTTWDPVIVAPFPDLKLMIEDQTCWSRLTWTSHLRAAPTADNTATALF